MKRKKKIQIVLSILLIILLVILGGYLFMKHQEKELMQEQKPRIEKYLYYTYNDIKSITLTGTHTNPTGVVHIEGYVNGNEKLWIDAALDGKNGVEVVNTATKLDNNYLKKEFLYESKNVTEIEAEEKAKKKSENQKSSSLNLNTTRSVKDILFDIKTVENEVMDTYPKHT